MGLKNIMFNLITTVVRAQSSGGATMKAGSKWMAVRKAMKTMSLLRNLLGVKKRFVRKAAEESNKEFNQISDIVKQFLESHCPVEKLVEAMEKRRTRALARALGF